MMFNKKRCEKCIYSMKYSGLQIMSRGKEHEDVGYLCGYCITTANTCLKSEGQKVADIRGTDPDHCKLYRPGRRKVKSIKGPLSWHDDAGTM